MGLKPETGFFRHCVKTAKTRGIQALIELIYYLENNKSISTGYDITRKDAIDVAKAAKKSYETDVMIKHQFLK